MNGIDDREEREICAALFGKSSLTFNKGKIGRWKTVFTDKHIEEFKVNTGDLLINLGYEDSVNWSR